MAFSQRQTVKDTKDANEATVVKGVVVEEEEDGTTYWEVSAVVGKRVRKGKVQYRIRWEGCTEEEDTWEPKENLTEGALEDVAEFEAKAAADKKEKKRKSNDKPASAKKRKPKKAAVAKDEEPKKEEKKNEESEREEEKSEESKEKEEKNDESKKEEEKNDESKKEEEKNDEPEKEEEKNEAEEDKKGADSEDAPLFVATDDKSTPAGASTGESPTGVTDIAEESIAAPEESKKEEATGKVEAARTKTE